MPKEVTGQTAIQSALNDLENLDELSDDRLIYLGELLDQVKALVMKAMHIRLKDRSKSVEEKKADQG